MCVIGHKNGHADGLRRLTSAETSGFSRQHGDIISELADGSNSFSSTLDGRGG